jgi:hypothetical protein
MKASDLPIKLAFSIEEAVAASGVGRTLIFEEIKAGRLVARKCGRRTLILKHDLALWLDALPRSVEVPN